MVGQEETACAEAERKNGDAHGKEADDEAVSSEAGTKRPGRRELFALAAVLAATALTGAAAIAGLTRSVPSVPTLPKIGQTITPAAPAPPRRTEPGG